LTGGEVGGVGGGEESLPPPPQAVMLIVSIIKTNMFSIRMMHPLQVVGLLNCKRTKVIRFRLVTRTPLMI
jgi:hypothetical protein